MSYNGFTGETILRTRPRTYAKIVSLISAGHSQNAISKMLRVSEGSVKAISLREAEEIAKRKKDLTHLMANIAQISGERALELAGKGNLTQSMTACGISIDKMLALLGETASGVPVQVNVNVDARAIHEKFEKLVNALPVQSE